MAVQYIIGGTGTGKSELCFKKIVKEAEKNPDKNYFVIVPEQFTLQTQKDLVRLSKAGAIMNIDVLSFMRLAYRVFEELDIKEKLILEDTGKNMVIRKLLGGLKEELCFYKNVVGKQGFTEDLKSLLSEFMQYGITPDNLTEIKEKTSSPVLAAKLQDAALVYRAFNNYKKEKYISAEQILEVLANEISRSKLLENSVICFDGYTGFTPVQLKVIDLLLVKAEYLLFTLTISEKDYYSEEDEKFRLFHLSKDTINKINKLAGERGVEVARPVTAEFCGKVKALSLLEMQIFRYPVKKTDSENAVRISACKNPREEVKRLIPDILSLVRDEGLRYRDIAVVLGDMEEYGEMVVDTLSSKGVPCFLDSKKTIADNPFVEYIKASLLVVEENFSYDAVMRYLRSGFAGVDADKVDIFENYILRRGIKGFRRYQTSFIKDEASEEESISEGLRVTLVDDFKPLYDILKSKKTKAEDFVKALYEFVSASGSEERLMKLSADFEEKGKMIAAREYAGCYRIVMSVFEKMYELLGDEKLSIEEFRNILESGFAEGKAGFIPPGLDQIVIGDVERTRLKDIKVLFCLGFNEGKVPKSVGVRGIITDTEKEKLASMNVELAPTAKERAFREQFYIYMLFSKPTERLYVSYSSSNMEGKPIKPSSVINRLRAVFTQEIVSEPTEEVSLINEIRKDGGMELILSAIRKRDLKDSTVINLIKYYNSHYDDKYNKIIEGTASKTHGNSLEKYIATKLYGELKGSVTRLELFGSCAYAHFIKHGLRLKERKEFELKPMDIGNILHEILERFAKKVVEKGESFNSISEETREAIQAESIAEAFNYGDDIFNASSRNNYQLTRLKRIADRAVRTVLTQIKSGLFTPVAFEEEFVTKGFKGRIDRIDSVLSDYLPDGTRLIDSREFAGFNKVRYMRVIDYKSGNKVLDLDRAYYGLDLQLFTYLKYIREELGKRKDYKNNLIIPSGAYYFHLDDPVIDFGGGEEAVIKSMRFDGITLEGKHHISLIDSNMADNSGLVADADSDVIKLKTKKDGEPSSLTKLYKREEMNALIDNSDLEIEKFKSRILKGEITPKPYCLGNEKGCDYCEYNELCGFDLKLNGYNYNRLRKIDKKQFFAELNNKLGVENGTKVD